MADEREEKKVKTMAQSRWKLGTQMMKKKHTHQRKTEADRSKFAQL